MVGAPERAAPLLKLTIMPKRRWRMDGNTALMRRGGPKYNVSIWERISSSVEVSTAANTEKPALLTKTLCV
jgi:hypothetical protein